MKNIQKINAISNILVPSMEKFEMLISKLWGVQNEFFRHVFMIGCLLLWFILAVLLSASLAEDHAKSNLSIKSLQIIKFEILLSILLPKFDVHFTP